MASEPTASVSVAEAKRRLGELLGRVAFGGATVLITRHGRPMAKLVPPGEGGPAHPAGVKGWLDDDDPFFATIDEIVAVRAHHRPRTARRGTARSRAR